MKKLTGTTILFLFFGAFLQLSGQWGKTYGPLEWGQPRYIKQTRDGGFIVTASFWAGWEDCYDIFIMKLYSSGSIEWQRVYRGAFQESPSYIEQTRDGGYILAGEDYYGLILKLDPRGNRQWGRIINFLDRLYSVRQTKDGGYIAAGDCFSVIKLSSSGNFEWQKKYDVGGTAQSIQQTIDGGYIVAGPKFMGLPGRIPSTIVLKLKADGEIEWQKEYAGIAGIDYENACSIYQAKDGGYIVAGSISYPGDSSNPNEDMLIFKLNNRGDIVWQRKYGADKIDRACSAQQTRDGGYIVSGKINSEVAFLKLSSIGIIEWCHGIGDAETLPGIDIYPNIQQTKDGGYVTACHSPSPEGIMVLKLFPDGYIEYPCPFFGNKNIPFTNTNLIPKDLHIKPKNTSYYIENSHVTLTNGLTKESLFCRARILRISATKGGTTDPSPGGHYYKRGKQVIVKAIPDVDYNFRNWTGDVPSGHGQDNPLTLSIDSDKTITANFSYHKIVSPLNFSGKKVINQTISLVEYLNILTWKANRLNANIAKYRIYQVVGEELNLLSEINASTFEYWHRKVGKEKSCTYALVAVNNENREGVPAYLTVR